MNHCRYLWKNPTTTKNRENRTPSSRVMEVYIKITLHTTLNINNIMWCAVAAAAVAVADNARKCGRHRFGRLQRALLLLLLLLYFIIIIIIIII